MTNNVVSQDEIIDKDEVLNMAEQAGFTPVETSWHFSTIEAFAKLVDAKATAKEREACKKECLEQFELSLTANEKAKRVRDKEAYLNTAIGAKYCLMRIEARGEA